MAHVGLTSGHWSRLLVLNNTPSEPATVGAWKTAFGPGNYWEPEVTELGEVLSRPVSQSQFTLFSEGTSVSVNGSTTLGNLEFSTVLPPGLVGVPTGRPTGLCMLLLDRNFTGAVTQLGTSTANFTLLFNWGQLDLLSLSVPTGDAITARFQWTPRSNWIGPTQ